MPLAKLSGAGVSPVPRLAELASPQFEQWPTRCLRQRALPRRIIIIHLTQSNSLLTEDIGKESQ